eukprot:PITA_07372
MDFDGAVGREGAGIGIWIRNPIFTPNKVPSNVRVCSYKLAFDYSNNEAEYEALITGLKILRQLNAKRISVYGDSELVIKQNVIADSLATPASNLKISMNSNNRFEIHVKHHPSVPDNHRYWQVFQDDEEIDEFLQNEGKFKDTSIDVEYDDVEVDIEVNQKEILQLKDNIIPKGLIPLEELFD